MPSDIDISQAASPKPILEIAETIGLTEDDLDLYGRLKAKVHLDVLDKYADQPRGKYIDVTAITPTPLGEGKTTTTVGLTQALGTSLGKRAVCAIRQPSMGPTFNLKGGAAGGGYSQVIPMEEFNLHLTGDIHAIGLANNLIAATLDTRMYHESRQSDEGLVKRGIERRLNVGEVLWRRVLDVTDRSLRNVEIGLADGKLRDGSPNPYFPRRTGFDITVASELMAILALTTSLQDMRERIGRAVCAVDTDGNPITIEDLGAAGAATVLMRESIMPTLMQTLEGQAAFIHAGPFANIATGNSSIIADQIALRMADYVITESGFGSDIGMEKFFNLKCRASGLVPDAVVLVATVRALKMHGGGPDVIPGQPLADPYVNEDLGLLEAGLPNLGAHIRIARAFGVPVVVAINAFTPDTQAEWDMIREYALAEGAEAAVVTTHWADGGPGGAALAEAVVAAAEKDSQFEFLYPLEMPIREKIETIATQVYGAQGVTYTDEAADQIARFEGMGYGELPICMAKTHLSLSHDPSLKGAPTGFTIPVREVRMSAGAGFVIPLLGTISTMPGMITRPALFDIDIDPETGQITGMF
ncbi:MAG: formate--tetrahydrofolate ligase [Chloroflexi bacterium]|nr:formate--tetrahydrofolate ligase [Chloroflexota bacterium]